MDGSLKFFFFSMFGGGEVSSERKKITKVSATVANTFYIHIFKLPLNFLFLVMRVIHAHGENLGRRAEQRDVAVSFSSPLYR